MGGSKLLNGANFASAGVGILNDTGVQFVSTFSLLNLITYVCLSFTILNLHIHACRFFMSTSYIYKLE